MTSTPIAKMVREMIERGVDIDVIELAVSTVECTAASAGGRGSPVDTAAEKRRTYDRERKAREREVHRMSGGNPRKSENAPLSEKEKIEERIPEREALPQSVRGNRLTDDWAPDVTDWQIAIEAIGADRSKAELAKFRDHWKQQPGSKGVKLDWAATWRNWIRRAAEYYGGRNGSRNINTQRRSSSADFFAGIAGVAADLAGYDQPSGSAAEEIPLGRINLEL
jgi:hypothetical protein